jgi:anti-sigma-K factor RskA
MTNPTPDTSTPIASTPTPRPGVSSWWRLAAVVLLVILSIIVATSVSMFEQFKAQVQHLQVQLKETKQLKYVAVLNDSKNVPAMLITMNMLDDQLQIQRLNGVLEGREESLQLWAMSEGDPTRSLGVLGSKTKTLQIPATERDLASTTTLAISVENKGGITDPKQAPSQPFLFQGTVIRKAL